MRPDTSTVFRLEMTVTQLEVFTGVAREKKKKMSCQLSEAVNGDFVSLPCFFFLSPESKPY